MKKFLALMLSLALVFALAACGQKDTGDSNTGDSSNTDASADWPKANTRYIITASAGGGLDICARMLAPYWEKATDNKTVVTVENVTGGANWIGWTEMFNATPDGSTVANIHTPQVFSYLNKALQNSNTLDSFNLLCNCVTDSVTIAVRNDDSRFADVNTLDDLANMLKSASSDFTVALTSKGGADELALLEFCDQAGVTNLIGINHSDGISAQKTSFLSGDCDLYFGKVGDTLTMYEEGTVKVLAVCKADRSSFLPDIATASEQGYEIIQGSDRGIVTQPGVPEEIKEAMVASLRAAQEDPEYLAAMEAAGYEVNYMDGEEYEQYIKDHEAVIIKWADELGYNG